MKIRNFVGIALLLILSLIYTWYEANRPRPVDWSETYSPKDKIPYGTYITYRSLPELFPDSKIRTSRLSIAEEFGSGRDTSAGTYIFVGSDYRIDALELKHLMQWVEKGNDMFVAAGWIADTLLNALSLKLEQNLKPTGSKLFFAPGHVYPFYKIRHGSYFVLPADFKGERLGERATCSPLTVGRIEKGAPTVAIGIYLRVLYALQLDDDILLLAKEDAMGKALQDLSLKKRERASKKE